MQTFQLSSVALVMFIASAPTIATTQTPFAEARRIILARMIDPSSTQFRNLRVKRATVESVAQNLICGQFNSKNRMGGYVGFASFAYSPQLRAVVTSSGDFYYADGKDALADSLPSAETASPNESFEAMMARLNARVDRIGDHFAKAKVYLNACA